MSLFVLAQSLAILAFLIGIIAYQRPDRKSILQLWAGSALLNTLHFLALNSIESALFSAATSVRFWVASRTSSKLALLAIVILILTLFMFIPRDDSGALAFSAALVGAIGAFQANPSILRLFLFASTSLWVINNYLIGSPIGFLMEVTFLIGNILGHRKSRK